MLAIVKSYALNTLSFTLTSFSVVLWQYNNVILLLLLLVRETRGHLSGQLSRFGKYSMSRLIWSSCLKLRWTALHCLYMKPLWISALSKG